MPQDKGHFATLAFTVGQTLLEDDGNIPCLLNAVNQVKRWGPVEQPGAVELNSETVGTFNAIVYLVRLMRRLYTKLYVLAFVHHIPARAIGEDK